MPKPYVYEVILAVPIKVQASSPLVRFEAIDSAIDGFKHLYGGRRPHLRPSEIQVNVIDGVLLED